jgi:hypothetical protein
MLIMQNAIIAIYCFLKPYGSYTTAILKQLLKKKKLETKNLWYNQYSQKPMSLFSEMQIWQTFLESLF